MNSKCSTTWSKSNEFQTYDGAKVKVFARFESESARRRHRGLCSRPAPTPLVEIFTGLSITTLTRSNDGEGDDFFFFTFEGLSSVRLLFYQRSDTALLLGISPDSWLAMFHSQRCSYIRTDDPSTKAMARRAFTVSWNVEVFVHSRRVVIFPQAPPSLVSSPSKYPPSFVALAFNKTTPAELSPRSPS